MGDICGDALPDLASRGRLSGEVVESLRCELVDVARYSIDEQDSALAMCALRPIADALVLAALEGMEDLPAPWATTRMSVVDAVRRRLRRGSLAGPKKRV